MSGLTITVVNATNLANIETFGKNDPYTSIEFLGQKQKTKVIDDNLNPEWNETVGFDLAGKALSGGDTLLVKVMDKEKIGPDRLIGSVDVPLNDLAGGKSEVQLNLNLMDKNKRPTTGYLVMKIKYDAPKSANNAGGGGGGNAAGNDGDGDYAEDDEGGDAMDGGSGGPSKLKGKVSKRKGNRSYSTKPQDFQVRVKVIEGRQLQGGNLSPVCKVKLSNQAKQTKVQKSTGSPFWNSSFFFNFHMSASDLFDEIISFELFNSRQLRSDALIGSFKFDLSMVYEEPRHAYINKWLLLSDPEDATTGAKGYLKICMAILGPGDEAPTFQSSADDGDDIESNLIRPAGLQLRPATFSLKIYQAEDLPKMDSSALQGIKKIFTGNDTKELIDPYFMASFAGKEIKSSTKYTDDHPEWNEEIKIGLQFPSMCDRLKLHIYDWDRVGNNDVVGTIFLSIAAIGSMRDENGFLPTFGPAFVNFYGGPREFSDLPDKYEALNLGKGDGVSYRGRALIELSTELHDTSIEISNTVTPIAEEHVLRVSKFLRRRKYRLHAAFMSANMIRESDAPIEFEVSMGNYGNKLDDTVPASSSCTQPTNAVFDGSYYYFLPWGDAKPCSVVDCQWEDISSRLFSSNYFLKIANRLKKDIERIRVSIDANIPEEEQAQFVIAAFDTLILNCNKDLPVWEAGQSPETALDRNLKALREFELTQIKTDAMRIREEATNVVQTLDDLDGFVTQLMNLSEEPQNSMPDVVIWMLCGGKRKFSVRIPANDLIWSNNEDYRGLHCGIIQNLYLKPPTLLDEKDVKDLMIPCQLRVKLWLGQEKEEVSWHDMQNEGRLTVMAETYENQASILGKWTTKSPLMTRPSWSDASGKVKVVKDQVNPPQGWAWDGDWFISPEMSLYFDKDAMLTEYMEDVFLCESRIPGGNWGPATNNYTDVKGDPGPNPNETPLPAGWEWSEDWEIDVNRPCDEEGWEYAVDQSIGGFQPSEKMYHMCRRRRYVRERRQVEAKKKKSKKAASPGDEHWEYSPMFDGKFHASERKIDMVRRRRWHRKMIATEPGAPCYFNLGAEEKKEKSAKGDDSHQKTSTVAPRMFLQYEKSYKWQLRAYIFQARDLLAADQNGFSDPYARVVFSGQSQTTEVEVKSICPTWDQTLIFKELELHNAPTTVRDYPPNIVIELFDRDKLGEDEFLGRCKAYPMVKLQPDDHRRAVLQWFPLKKGSRSAGEVLAAFEIYLIGEQDLPNYPSHRGNLFCVPDGIRPMMQRTGVEILSWGVRNMKKYQLLNVTSPSVEIEIGGTIVETKMIKNVKKNPNFLDPFMFVDVMLPREELYMPPMNIKVRDHRPFGRKPIVGTFCLKTSDQFRCMALTEEHDALDDYPELYQENIVSQKLAPVHGAPPALEALFEGRKKANMVALDEDIDWWSKYYASLGKIEKCRKYLEMGYDTLTIYGRELEFSENYEEFSDFCSTFYLTRGSNDENDEDDENDSVGEFKGSFRIYELPEDRNEPLPLQYLETGLPSNDIVECVVRVYIVKAYDLQPDDPNGLADPYIEVVLGDQKQSSKDSYIPNSLTPEFGRMFELKAKIPVAKDLTVRIMDYDLLSKDDVIGETQIDLENRYLTRYRAMCGLPKTYCTSGPNQWRDNQLPSVILAGFCETKHLPIPEFAEETNGEETTDATLRIGQKVFRLSILEKDLSAEAQENPHRGPLQERLALHVLNKLPFVREHIEVRSLYSPLQPGIEQGKVEMWVDIHPLALGPPGPPFSIRPRTAKKYELRIIVWNTQDVKLDETNLLGERMSDIYVKGWINGIDEKQETDVHYRSLDGEGNFNWRFVLPFDYIPSENVMVVKKKEHFWSLDTTEQRLPCGLVMQIWDNDKFSADDFLGTLEVDLSSIPVPVKKKNSCKLEQLVQFGGSDFQNLFEAKRSKGFWPVYDNSTGTPELTGKLELELELLTVEEATLRPAGRARDDPNDNPKLDPPNRPATSFFWFTSPWKTFKFILWNKAKFYIITGLVVILLLLLVVLFVYAIPGLAARKMFSV